MIPEFADLTMNHHLSSKQFPSDDFKRKKILWREPNSEIKDIHTKPVKYDFHNKEFGIVGSFSMQRGNYHWYSTNHGATTDTDTLYLYYDTDSSDISTYDSDFNQYGYSLTTTTNNVINKIHVKYLKESEITKLNKPTLYVTEEKSEEYFKEVPHTTRYYYRINGKKQSYPWVDDETMMSMYDMNLCAKNISSEDMFFHEDIPIYVDTERFLKEPYTYLPTERVPWDNEDDFSMAKPIII